MTAQPTLEDLAQRIEALRAELAEFRGATVYTVEFGEKLADRLEERVAALEEVAVRHWPARRLATARLRRAVRASMRHILQRGENWQDWRDQAAHVELHAGLDGQRAAG